VSQVSVLVVDDHPLFRQGVVDALSLEPGIRVVGQASDGLRGLDQIRALDPDVAIVDVNLPGLNGQHVTHQIVMEKLRTRVILLTGYDDSEQILHAAIAGALILFQRHRAESLVKRRCTGGGRKLCDW
jgi:DNA-binding NarL/FixJ family response regulator